MNQVRMLNFCQNLKLLLESFSAIAILYFKRDRSFKRFYRNLPLIFETASAINCGCNSFAQDFHSLEAVMEFELNQIIPGKDPHESVKVSHFPGLGQESYHWFFLIIENEIECLWHPKGLRSLRQGTFYIRRASNNLEIHRIVELKSTNDNPIIWD